MVNDVVHRFAYTRESILATAALVRLHERKDVADCTRVALGVDKRVPESICVSLHQVADAFEHGRGVLEFPQAVFRRVDVEFLLRLFEDRVVNLDREFGEELLVQHRFTFSPTREGRGADLHGNLLAQGIKIKILFSHYTYPLY